jgi:WD40 repeat protein
MEKTFSFTHLEDLPAHRSGIYAMLQGDAPNELISAGGDGMVIAWNIDKHSTHKVLTSVKEVIFSMMKTPVKGVYLLGTMSGCIYKFDRNNNTTDKMVIAHQNGVFDMLFIDDNKLASIGADGILKTWDYPSFNPIHEVKLSEIKLRSFDINKSLGHIAIGSIQGVVTVVDVKNLKTVIRFKGHDRGIYLVKYHPHKNMLITGCIDGVLNFWDTTNNYKHIYSRPAHQSSIYGFDHHKWDDMYVTVSKDKSIKIWDPSFYKPKTIDRFTSKGHIHSVNAVVWLLNGVLATAGDDRKIKLWDVKEEITP